jgi:uncharacterized SAM-binding protein YcdF (DUF218 family)
MQRAWDRLRRLTVWVLAVYGAAVATVLYSPVANWAAMPLIVEAHHDSADVIVLLTAWATPNGILNEAGVWRTLEAARLYRAGLSHHILVTGGPTGEGGDPGAAMVAMLGELGVPKDAIQLEDGSANTHESAVNVARLLLPSGRNHVLLVTDGKHMRRARGAFERAGLRVSPAPAMQWELWWEQPYYQYRKMDGAVHEYVGLLYYWWKGWI